MPDRLIKSSSRSGTAALSSLLSSLFALELMSPSSEVYLISPWISNIPLLSNRFGQFRPVMGDSGESPLRLATILGILAERGSVVRVMYRPHPPFTEEFLNLLPENVARCNSATIHENGLVTSHFYLRGSMNFTYSGVSLNDEHVEFTDEKSEVALALLEARQRWKEFAQ